MSPFTQHIFLSRLPAQFGESRSLSHIGGSGVSFKMGLVVFRHLDAETFSISLSLDDLVVVVLKSIHCFRLMLLVHILHLIDFKNTARILNVGTEHMSYISSKCLSFMYVLPHTHTHTYTHTHTHTHTRVQYRVCVQSLRAKWGLVKLKPTGGI